jgi:hypothetical protein
MTIAKTISERSSAVLLILIASLLFFPIAKTNAQNVGIGTSAPHTSAMLDVRSSDKGLLIPRMRSSQRQSVINPANGLMIYDTSTSSIWFYQKNQWQELGYGTNSADSSFIFGQQSGTLAAYNGDPSGNLVLATDTSGFFYDNGGPSGNYSNNANYFFAVIVSGNVIGYKLQVLSNNLEYPYDSLFIYTAGDYPIADTLLGSETASYVLPNNPIVIKFKSNFVNTAPGFVIRWDAIMAPAVTNTSQALVAGWQYDRQKLAMHGGFNLNNNWHTDSSGLFSLNYGYGNKAKGNYSLALGGYTSSPGSYSSAFGYGSVASGISSTTIGYIDTASGNYSAAFGYATASKGEASFTSGYYTVASNDHAFATGDHSVASGFTSTAMGREAKAIGSGSTVIGSYSEANATNSSVFGGAQNYASAPYATAIGGVFCTASGDYSIAMGNYVSTNGKIGSMALGDINPSSALSCDADNQMLMRFIGGYKLYLNNATLAMTINNLSNVGIGITNPDEKLHVNGNIKCASLIQTSDSRLKRDIAPLRNSLNKLVRLNGYTYRWKDLTLDEGLQTGVLAQEVKQLFPHLVKQDKEGMLAVNYSGLIAVTIESIKEQQKQIDELKKDRLQMQEQVNELKKIVEKIVSK